MNAELPLRFILVAEGPSDIPRIRVLVDHLLRKHGERAKVGDALPEFIGLGSDPYIPLRKIPELARSKGLDRRYSAGGPRKGDGGTLRKLHQVLQKEKLLAPGNIILWVRDDDGDRARRADVEEARRSLPASPPILFAIASECGEAWVLAGFKASTAAEQAKLRAWRKKLGFEPHVHPDRLSHKDDVPRSAKAVVRDLFEGDAAREADALIAAAESSGPAAAESGLVAFCAEVSTCALARRASA